MARAIDVEKAIKIIEEKQKELCPVGRYGRNYVYGSDREKYDAWEEIIDALDNLPTLTPPNEKPPCYLPEKDNPYPLCEGRGMKACAHCCLWEDYDPEEDESRVNQPLTLEQLREMDGEPVWVQTPGIPKYGRWVIVAGVNTEDGQRTLYCQGDYTCRNYRRDWIAYRRPPEGEI